MSIVETSSSLLRLVGATPALGRLFTAEEDAAPSRSALLSHEAWQRDFGGRPDVVGQVVMLRNPIARVATNAFEVVGVLAPDVRLYRETPDLVVPIGRRESAMYSSVSAIGRLAPDWTIAQASTVAEPIVRRLALPDEQTIRVVTLTEDLLGGSPRPLWLLFGGAGLLLLVTCSSVAGLLIADARARRHEMAVQAALGATRRRMLRQLVLEHLALATAAAALGLCFAVVVGPAMLLAAPLGALGVGPAGISIRIAAFALAAGFATPLLFGLAPLLILRNVEPSHALTLGGSRQTFRRGTSHGAVVAMQVALALVLVTGAAMFGETMIRLTTRPLGFDPSNLAMLNVTPMRALPSVERFDGDPRTDPDGARRSFERNVVLREALLLGRVFERLSGLPGVLSVAGGSAMPFDRRPRRIQVRPPGRQTGDAYTVEAYNVTERYFHTMRIPIVRGRDFTPEDRLGGVAIVSEAFERRVFGGDAVGRRFLQDSPAPEEFLERVDEQVAGLNATVEVIGVSGNVKHRGFHEDDLAAVYFLSNGVRQLVVRTSGSPADILPHVRRAVLEAGPELTVTSMTTLNERVAATTRAERFRALLSSVFGLVALVLAAVGLYGLTARQVIERRREIGVRMALGARPGHMGVLMLRQGLGALAIGLAAGAPAAYAVSHAAQSLLFGISPTNPRLLLMSVGVLAVTAIVATSLPAHRASRVDPSTTLRE